MDGHSFQYKNSLHPRSNANWFSVLTFSWMIPLFYKGVRRSLNEEDLYRPLPDNRSVRNGDLLERAWEAEIERARIKCKSPNFLRALMSVFGKTIIYQGILVFVLEFAVRLSQPFFLGGLITYLSSSNENLMAYVCAGGLIGTTIIAAFIMHYYHMGIVLTGMNMRVATCSLIYRTVLAMKGPKREVNAQVANLVTNDAMRFDYAVTCLHDLWIAPLQVVVVTYFLYRIVGAAAFVGMAVMFLTSPFQVWMGKTSSMLRKKTAEMTAVRINLISEVLDGILVVKTLALEPYVTKLIKMARSSELNIIGRMAIVRSIMTSFQMYHVRSATALTILTYVLMGGTLTAFKAFMITSFFGVIGSTVGVFFPTGILLVSECLTTIKRVQAFLREHTEIKVRNFLHSQTNDVIKEVSDSLILKQVSSTWIPNGQTLSDVTFEARIGRPTVVLGAVGSGKTSLLQTILGEMLLTSGSISAPNRISYASQEPWLFPGSIRRNILFGEDFDEEKYQTVVHQCALESDFELFKYNDFTVLGENGALLSGGQKARVNLARAVYKDAEVYLFDDPLSAVDNLVRDHLLNRCIRPLSKRKIVIFVTHTMENLLEDDHIVFLENGSVQCEGTIRELSDEGNLPTPQETIELDEAPVDFTITTIDTTPPIERKHKASVCSSVTSELSLGSVGSIQPHKKKKQSSFQMYFNEGGCTFGVVLLFFIIGQMFGSATDYWVTIWVNLEESAYDTTGFTNEMIKLLPIDVDRKFCLWVFAALILGTFVVTIVRSMMFFFTCLRSSKILHKNMFTSFIKAKMQFHYTTRSGMQNKLFIRLILITFTILPLLGDTIGRFSKDQGIVDEILPVALMDFLQIGLTAVGIFVVIPLTNPWLAILSASILAIFYGFRHSYVLTTKNLREIESRAKNPLLTHLHCTLDGLDVIHCRAAENMVSIQFDNLQDFHTSAWYLYLSANRAFAFWLDIFCAMYTALVTLSFIVFSTGNVLADVGLAITQCGGLAYAMQWSLRQSAEVENSLVSVKRIKEYSELESEDSYNLRRGIQVMEGWPNRGSVDFVDVYMQYSRGSPWILKGLTFSIKPGQKVGIVGRTGSGKSSIALALFRLVDFEGCIKVDGVDIKLLELSELRPRITFISQEPVLFSGTIRSNMDPLNEYDDEQIWNALRTVEMADFVAGQEGLMTSVDNSGGNLSSGQKQLLCLARGILHCNRIIVLDEATANVDKRTESIIMKTVDKQFKAATVITIAHRIRTVMESDVLLVLEAGRIKQIGTPRELVNDKNGLFHHLVNEAKTYTS